MSDLSISSNLLQRITKRISNRLRAILPTWLKSLLRPFVKPLFDRLVPPPPPLPRFLTEEMLRLNRAAAQQYGVESTIHPGDFIYWYILNHPSFPSLEAAIGNYFENGSTSAKLFTDIIASLGLETDRAIKLLEFASGYGCVSRHLKQNTLFDLVACDIHPEAVDFLVKQIGVEAVQSVHMPEEFSPPAQYDVVFALSFFSHMPKMSFGRWLRALFGSLNVPGYLVFTTHGLASHKILGSPPLSPDGFWFSPSSEQKDLDVAEYGTTISTPDFVTAELFRQTGAPIVAYKYAYWWEHQDLWVVKREK